MYSGFVYCRLALFDLHVFCVSSFSVLQSVWKVLKCGNISTCCFMQIFWFELPLELMFFLLNDLIHKPYSKRSCNGSFRFFHPLIRQLLWRMTDSPRSYLLPLAVCSPQLNWMCCWTTVLESIWTLYTSS